MSRAIVVTVLVLALALAHDRGVGAHHGLMMAGICLCMTMLPNSYFRDCRDHRATVMALWIDQGKWLFCILLLVASAVTMLGQGLSVLQADFMLFAQIGLTGHGRRVRMAKAAVVLVVAAACGMASQADLPVAALLMLGSSLYLLLEPMWAAKTILNTHVIKSPKANNGTR